ncbi:Ubiquinone biosynthesi monooxygenase COQ6 mitochondrial [Taenia crassiceps]|uniref:Ubiquinone biosynthesi monooxygenase COQ6 mitochondrial n=1 Tax=Taenia crassiceps TaxID=6207 RepID=A0ABR4QCG9_9CEST
MLVGLIGSAPLVQHLRRSLSSRALKSHYDVVVIGGGMVGLGFAAFAGLQPMLRNKRILLIEGGPKKEYVKRSDHSTRVVAITPASVGAWSQIENTHCQAIQKMKVIENGTTASLLLERRNPNDVMGYIVENDLIVSSLIKSIEKFAAESGTDTRPGSIELLYDTPVGNLRIPKAFSDNDFAELTVRQCGTGEDSTIKTSLLVGADGFNSAVRKASGIHTIGWQHDQSAIIANLTLGPEYDYTVAWQRFTETGPIAYLPFGPERCSVTWSTTRSEAKRLMALSDEGFVNELNFHMSQPPYHPSGIVSALSNAIRMSVSKKTTSFVPPKILSVQPGTRTQFPLNFSHCTFYHGPRVALIGDAAHRILPLSGQGVNMGFGDAACLAETINRSLFHGEDVADPKHLSRFTSERQRSVFPLGVFIEGLQALYAPDEVFGGPLKMDGPPASKLSLIRRLSARYGVSDAVLSLRGLGLDLVDACVPLKHFFVEGAVKDFRPELYAITKLNFSGRNTIVLPL